MSAGPFLYYAAVLVASGLICIAGLFLVPTEWFLSLGQGGSGLVGIGLGVLCIGLATFLTGRWIDRR